jgi:hypothetical protein
MSTMMICLRLPKNTQKIPVSPNISPLKSKRTNLSDLAYDWLIELTRILKASVDYSADAHYDLLMRNTTIQLFLSIQNSLGLKGSFQPRTFPGKLSWLALQLRNIVVLVTMATNYKVPTRDGERTSPLDDPGMILFNQLAEMTNS